jgi:CBS domain-containing protein
MLTVLDLVAKKGHTIWSIEPEAKVYDALQVMAEKNIGALLVIEKKNLIGVISERDYARKIILKGKASREVPVREIMSSPVITISPRDDLEKALELMTRNHIRHLPVVEGGEIQGVLSMRDVMEAIIQNQDDTIRFLNDLASDTI